MLYIKHFIIFMVFVGLSKLKKNPFIMVIRIEDFVECPKHGNVRVQNVSVEMLGKGNYVINFVTTVLETVPYQSMFVITMYKCKSSSASDCEYVMKFTIDFCSMVSQRNQAWTSFLDHSVPKMKCPMKPGVYRMVNSSFDAKELMSFGSVMPRKWAEDYHWRFRGELNGPNKENLMCVVTMVAYQRLRNI